MDLSAIDVEDLLVRLDLAEGMRLTSGGDEIHFACFGGEHNDGGAAYINVNSALWTCHGCHRRGSALTLVMEVQNVSRPTAEGILREWYGIEFDEPVGGSMVHETEARFRPVIQEPDPPKPPRSWLSGVRVDWDNIDESWAQYILDRGFTPNILESWMIGYDFLANRLTIPVFDVDGELFGIKGRAWTPENHPKYLIFGDRERQRYGFAPYEASQVVFGLNRNRDCKTAVVVEGEINAMALAQLGVERPVAIGMSYFSERHAELITREADEVVVYLDHGDAGHQGTWGRADSSGRWRPGVVQMLEPHMRVRIAEPLPEDPADLLKQGRGQEALDIIANARSSLAFAI